MSVAISRDSIASIILGFLRARLLRSLTLVGWTYSPFLLLCLRQYVYCAEQTNWVG